ncbi:hypothetical protein Cgig2_023900 [Carnegiea gigantea]|uniref:Uncharacterized protein n=1 Tax=Carnegiea gigantea TaxID=171969 RepID=A0A9Q1GUH8_9CARY|nr:hypothetical protein Cgig2_023900 [Carnegiea gigantea]
MRKDRERRDLVGGLESPLSFSSPPPWVASSPRFYLLCARLEAHRALKHSNGKSSTPRPFLLPSQTRNPKDFLVHSFKRASTVGTQAAVALRRRRWSLDGALPRLKNEAAETGRLGRRRTKLGRTRHGAEVRMLASTFKAILNVWIIRYCICVLNVWKT